MRFIKKMRKLIRKPEKFFKDSKKLHFVYKKYYEGLEKIINISGSKDQKNSLFITGLGLKSAKKISAYFPEYQCFSLNCKSLDTRREELPEYANCNWLIVQKSSSVALTPYSPENNYYDLFDSSVYRDNQSLYPYLDSKNMIGMYYNYSRAFDINAMILRVQDSHDTLSLSDECIKKIRAILSVGESGNPDSIKVILTRDSIKNYSENQTKKFLTMFERQIYDSIANFDRVVIYTEVEKKWLNKLFHRIENSKKIEIVYQDYLDYSDIARIGCVITSDKFVAANYSLLGLAPNFVASKAYLTAEKSNMIFDYAENKLVSAEKIFAALHFNGNDKSEIFQLIQRFEKDFAIVRKQNKAKHSNKPAENLIRNLIDSRLITKKTERGLKRIKSESDYSLKNLEILVKLAESLLLDCGFKNSFLIDFLSINSVKAYDVVSYLKYSLIYKKDNSQYQIINRAKLANEIDTALVSYFNPVVSEFVMSLTKISTDYEDFGSVALMLKGVDSTRMEADKINPKLSRALQFVVRNLSLFEKWELALKVSERAVEYSHSWFNFFYTVEGIGRKLGDNEVITSHLRKLRKKLDKPNDYIILSKLYLTRFNFAESLKIMKHAFNRFNNDPWIMANYANVCSFCGSSDEEVHEIFRKAIAKKPSSLSVQTMYAEFCIRKGQFQLANSELIKAGHNIRERIRDYTDRRLSYNLGDIKRAHYSFKRIAQSKWFQDQKELNYVQNLDKELHSEKNILLAKIFGPGDEVRFSTIYPDLIKDFKNLSITCDFRFERLFTRSFPQIKFIPTFGKHRGGVSSYKNLEKFSNLRSISMDSFFDNNSWEYAKRAEVVTLVTDIIEEYRSSYNEFPLDRKSVLVADSVARNNWRKRLDDLDRNIKVGISWRSGLTTFDREEHYTEIETWKEVFELKGITFINLQYDDCTEELRNVKNIYGIDVLSFSDLDLYNDFDNQAALISELDLVISPCTVTLELAGALGTQAFFTSNMYENNYRVSPINGRDIWHQNVKVVSSAPIGDKASMIRNITEEIKVILKNKEAQAA